MFRSYAAGSCKSGCYNFSILWHSIPILARPPTRFPSGQHFRVFVRSKARFPPTKVPPMIPSASQNVSLYSSRCLSSSYVTICGQGAFLFERENLDTLAPPEYDYFLSKHGCSRPAVGCLAVLGLSRNKSVDEMYRMQTLPWRNEYSCYAASMPKV